MKIQTISLFFLFILFGLGYFSILKESRSAFRHQNDIIKAYSDAKSRRQLIAEYPEIDPKYQDIATLDMKKANYGKSENDFNKNNYSKANLDDIIRESILGGMQDLKLSKLINPSNHIKRKPNKFNPDYATLKNTGARNSLISSLQSLPNRQLIQKKSTRSLGVQQKSKKSKGRKLEYNFDEFVADNFVPQRAGLLGLGAGALWTGIKSHFHKKKMKKLNELAKNQAEIDLHTKENEELMNKIMYQLRRTNNQVQSLKTIADQRLGSKIEQLRLY